MNECARQDERTRKARRVGQPALQGEAVGTQVQRHTRWRMCKQRRRDADAKPGKRREWLHRHQERLAARLVLDQLQLGKEGRVFVAEAHALRRGHIIGVMGDHHHRAVHSRVPANGLPRQARVGNADEQREQPHPEHQGCDGLRRSAGEAHGWTR